MIPVETICWYSALAFGITFFLYGFILLKKLSKKSIKEEHFAKAAAFEIAALWVMYIPEELYNDIPDSMPVLKTIESIFTSLLRAFNIYQGNGYERVHYADHPVFSSFYAIVMTLANISLILFVAGFIIHLFDGPVQRILLSMRKRRDTYIFPVCNDKTLTIAGSINESKKKEKKNLVFTCSKKDLDSQHKNKLESIKGIPIASDVTYVLSTAAKKSKKIEIFLFGNAETDNLEELERICSFSEKHIDAKISVYVELSETPWNLYNGYLEERKKRSSTVGENFIINFVRTEENFAYNNLLKNSIFENAISSTNNGSREIKFLLVGMNERNIEMLKAVLHLSQMPMYRLTLMVIDPHANRNELRCKMPEIEDVCDVEGDAIYTLIYKENVPLESDQFESIIQSEYLDFTFAFINADDDITNANLAMRLNAICYRDKKNDPYKIQVSIANERIHRSICSMWNSSLLEHIDVVGSLYETYDYSFIAMSDLEWASSAIHDIRYPKDHPGSPTWTSYCNNEYNRHSVYARTLSLKYRIWMIDKFYDSDYDLINHDTTWKKYEHMRWNVYTRTLGYVRAKSDIFRRKEIDKTLRGIAKIHGDLVNYDDLPEEVKEKDTLKLTPEIIEILTEKSRQE